MSFDIRKKLKRRSRKYPPRIRNLRHFQKAFTKLIENIKFRKVSRELLATLKESIIKINFSGKIFFSTERNERCHEISKGNHNKILINNFKKTCKKSKSHCQ